MIDIQEVQETIVPATATGDVCCLHAPTAWDVVSLIVFALTIYSVFQFFRRPVERDRILARGVWSTALLVLTFIVAIPFAASAIAFLCGFCPEDFFKGEESMDTGGSLLKILMYHFTDAGNLHYVRDGAPLYFAWGCGLLGICLLAGLLVSTMVNLVDKRSQMWNKGLIRYKKFFSDYVVVIGGNEQVATVVKDALSRKGVKYVLILTGGDVENLRMRISSQLTPQEEKRIVIYYGNQTSLEEIKLLRLDKALEIYILGESTGSINPADHDAYNMNTLKHISTCAILLKLKRRIKCHVAIEHQSTFTLFKYTEISSKLSHRIEFLPFNIYDIWAKRVLVDGRASVVQGRDSEEQNVIRYLPLWGDECIGPDSQKTVHLVIIGMDTMSTALAMEAAQLLHFPNFERDNRLRSTITFISTDAIKEANYLMGRFANLFALAPYRLIDLQNEPLDKPWTDPMKLPDARYAHLGDNFMDIQWQFIQANVADPRIREYLCRIVSDPKQVTTVAVTLSDPQKSLAAALYLPETVLKNALQILVYQSNMPDIAEYLASGDNVWKRYSKIRAFGMIENCYEEISADTDAAKLLNFFYNLYKYKDRFPDGLPPHIQYSDIAHLVEKEWALQQNIANKWSSNHSVDAFEMKLRAAGSSCHDNVDNQIRALADEKIKKYLPRAEHNRWLTERLIMGYRPLDDTEKEWRVFIAPAFLSPADDAGRKAKAQLKNTLKERRRAHLDIVSNDTLARIDSACPYNDIKLVNAIPTILRLAEEAKIYRRDENSVKKPQ